MIVINKEGNISYATYIVEQDEKGNSIRQFTGPGTNDEDALANLRNVLNSSSYENKNSAVAEVDSYIEKKTSSAQAQEKEETVEEINPELSENLEAITKELNNSSEVSTATTRDMVSSTTRKGNKTVEQK